MQIGVMADSLTWGLVTLHVLNLSEKDMRNSALCSVSNKGNSAVPYRRGNYKT